MKNSTLTPDLLRRMDAIDRLPQTGDKGIHLKQELKDKLIEHQHHIQENGEDMPEIRNWKREPIGPPAL